MSTQSTRCASEELAELEEWLQSKGLSHVDKSEAELQPGEYIKVLEEPGDAGESTPPVWTVTWYPEAE
ncbi:MAG TPA: hypothetical protein VK973_17365 [Arenicellales bacterium]|nr:hypothetical protein [Arenicellales bacterium]